MFNVRCFFRRETLLALLLLWSSSAVAQTGPCATVVPGQPLPDLIVDPEQLKDLFVTTERFGQTQCAVVEGCVTTRGSHQLLRFTTSTPNVGQGDLVIGDPYQCPNLFHQSECHGHLHFKEYTDYRLWTQAGYQNWITYRQPSLPTNSGMNATLLSQALQNGDLLVGRKQGFCIMDVARYNATTPQKYTNCGEQGLQIGWTDIYVNFLDCQYIQIDGLNEGVYVLENQVNPEHLLPESNYGNNAAAVQFRFVPKHGKTPAQVLDKLVLP
jgi:hypothetical protein